ncbi:glycosyltransferase family 2 protein [Paraglaciecola marina]|uniref:glycosyltransferase family 2 protein n=1 Tax=Paraglaciecola marina TaxID=2500157 RepID=UPI0010610BB2|nr:glycosyltransferase family A protein [Paraglaciecola marina]
MNNKSQSNTCVPLVSVIVPNYNHYDYLEQRLQSIAKQTYSNLEIILLDDASSDKSVSRLEEFSLSDARVKTFIKNSDNSGSAFVQWIKGVEQASGKYLWIAESDDCSDLHFIECLVEQLEQQPKAALAYCHSNWIDAESNPLGLMDIHVPYFKENYWLTDFCLDGDEVNRNLMPYRNVVRNASSALFRITPFKAALKGVSPSGRIDDWLFYVLLLKGNILCFVNRELNFCRLHSGNFSRSLTSQSYVSNIKQRIGVFRKIIAEYPDGVNSVEPALKILWRNRFKYKSVDTLITRHQSFGTYALYGFNDLSKYFISRCTSKPLVIFDKKIIDSSYSGTSLSRVDDFDLVQLDTVIVMSIYYQVQMRKILQSLGFKGRVLCLEVK